MSKKIVVEKSKDEQKASILNTIKIKKEIIKELEQEIKEYEKDLKKL